MNENRQAEGSDTSVLHLPLLTARPANVGVQLDSYRNMNVFDHRRNNKFTNHFHGFTFENSSMENFGRILERQEKKMQLAKEQAERAAKMREQLQAEDIRRRQRRKEREMERNQRAWLHQQALKEQRQQEREIDAATNVQRITRGVLARKVCRARREQMKRNDSSRTIQRFVRQSTLKREKAKRLEEAMKEKENAAVVLQRHTRKRQERRKLEQLELTPVAYTSIPEVDIAELEVNEEDEEEEEPVTPLVVPDEVLSPSSSEEEKEKVEDSPIATPVVKIQKEDGNLNDVEVRKPTRPKGVMKRVGGGYRRVTIATLTNVVSAPSPKKRQVVAKMAEQPLSPLLKLPTPVLPGIQVPSMCSPLKHTLK